MAKYGYGRVSSVGQQLNGNSLEEQEKALRDAGAEEIVLECFTGTKNRAPLVHASAGEAERREHSVCNEA